MRTAIQLYTLRDLDEPLADRIERVADVGYEGVEFAGLYGNDPADVAETLDETGLDAVAAHLGADDIEAEYDDLLAAYGELDCDRFVVPSYDHEAFESREGVAEAADRLDSLAERLADDGVDLCYHNHVFEFAEIDGTTGFDAFVEETAEVDLELDVGLATHAGADAVDLLERYADRIELVHVTDTVPGDDDHLHIDLGEGEVPLQECIDAARDTASDWLIYENGRTDHPARSAADDYETLRKYLE